MKNICIALSLICFTSTFGQIEHIINKSTGPVVYQIAEIDSIRFSGTNILEVVLNNSIVESHFIDELNSITYSMPAYPSETVFCDDGIPTAIVDVINPVTGKTWMDRNLGASQVAASSTDANSYGDLYQWGRGADGHQCRNSATTTTLSSSDQPGHGDFITINSGNLDWRSPQNTNLWQGDNGINNPCPSGYRLPTDQELNAERTSWSSNNAAGAIASPLKLPVAGYRSHSTGGLYVVGSSGFYWSSTVSGTGAIGGARGLNFNSTDASMSANNRAHGYSVRCLKD